MRCSWPYSGVGLAEQSFTRTKDASTAATIGDSFVAPIASMSRRGNCWDNAVAESFFGSLKKEPIKKRIFKNREIAQAEISDYIESSYNRTRRHSQLGGVSPEEFEAAARRPRNRVH
jgi:transposase InsO family protein